MKGTKSKPKQKKEFWNHSKMNQYRNIIKLTIFTNTITAFTLIHTQSKISFQLVKESSINRSPYFHLPTLLQSNNISDENDDEEIVIGNAELITLDEDDLVIDDFEEEQDQDWISDRDLIRRAASSPGGEVLTNRDKETLVKIRSADASPIQNKNDLAKDDINSSEMSILERQNVYDPSTSPSTEKNSDDDVKPEKSVYTDEEEELINAMGGKGSSSSSKNNRSSSREPGYLGDSTLREIAMDFSVPICYIADVLVTWGSPIPIDPNAVLGDLVTGEQAFALLEAIHTLDISALHDRYSDDDIITIADEYEIELKDAFDFAVKEGWSLPFGVRTHLRIEQENELIRALADDIM